MNRYGRRLIGTIGRVLVPGQIAGEIGRLARRDRPDRDPLDHGPSDRDLLDRFESLGDSCEFATLQKRAGVDTVGLFKWSATPPDRLADLIRSDLHGIDRPEHVAIRAELRQDHPSEYMIDHALLRSPMHSFVHEDEMTIDEALQRQMRRLGLLKRKFLADMAEARRVYVYRSLAPRPIEEMRDLHAALREKGPNTLLFVRPPCADLPAGAVTVEDGGLMVGALDRLALYEASTAIRSAMWPALLRRALRTLDRAS